MSDDVQKAYEELAAYGTASVMIVRNEEMPAIVEAAMAGNEDARMRVAAVRNVLPLVEGHNCLVCNRPVSLHNVVAMVFVSKEIKQGADALWTLLCVDCDEPDPTTVAQKAMDKLGFKRLLHPPGHA